MKSNYLLFIFFLLPLTILSQTISFESEETLFEHPYQPDTYFYHPFIPFDYNNDGITDFTGTSKLEQYIYKGLADGTFSIQQNELSWAQDPIKVIDWNNDGLQDIVYEGYIAISSDNDQFNLIQGITTEPFESIVDVADVNNDMFYDLMTIERPGSNDHVLALYINNGNDTFEKHVIAEDDDYEVAIFGDINLDSAIDVVYSGSVTHIGLNNGDGIFTNTDDTYDPTDSDLLLADLDNDMDLDLIVLNGLINIYENVEGTILESSEKKVISPANTIRSGDFNNDGIVELVTVSYGNTDVNIRLLQNTEIGNFEYTAEKISSFPIPSQWGSLNAESNRNNLNLYDHDNDGRLDIIYVDGVSDPNGIKWLRNNTLINSVQNVNSANLKLYPNPALNTLFVELGKNDYDKYEILNIHEQIVDSGYLNSNEIDIADLPAGNFVIKFLSSNKSGTIHTRIFVKM